MPHFTRYESVLSLSIQEKSPCHQSLRQGDFLFVNFLFYSFFFLFLFCEFFLLLLLIIIIINCGLLASHLSLCATF